MYLMFCGCESLKELDLSNFDTSNVSIMGAMFVDCDSLTSLDVTNFNTYNVKNMEDMFNSCNNLENLNISSFGISSYKNIDEYFEDDSCTVLVKNNDIKTLLQSKFSNCTFNVKQ